MEMKDVLNEKGYLFCPKLIADPENLYCDPPLDDNGGRLAGQINYYRKDKFTYEITNKNNKSNYLWYVAKSPRGDLNAYSIHRNYSSDHFSGEHNF